MAARPAWKSCWNWTTCLVRAACSIWCRARSGYPLADINLSSWAKCTLVYWTRRSRILASADLPWPVLMALYNSREVANRF